MKEKQPPQHANNLSRRQWLERVSVPALGGIGASMIGTNAVAYRS